MLNTRQLSILQLLLRQEEPISAQKTGCCLGLSARTVRYNLPHLQRWLGNHDVLLVNKPKYGVFILATKDQRRILINMLNHNSPCDFHLKQKNRCLWIEFELLNSGGPFKAGSFQYVLGFSHNTLAKDLLLVGQKLTEHGLTLKRVPGLGTFIEGPELQYRQRLISLICEVIDEGALIDACLWRKTTTDAPWTEKGLLKTKILKTIDSWKLREAWRLFSKLATSLECQFADTELVRLTLYTALADKRIQEGHRVDLSPEKLSGIKNTQEFRILQQLFPAFFTSYAISFSEAEIGQLALRVSTSKRLTTMSEDQHSDLDEMALIAQKILKVAEAELGYNVLVPEVIKMLSQHLMLSLNRLRNGQPIYNPILDDIEKKYAETIEIVKRAINSLAELAEFDLPLSEIAYIALYVEMAKHEAGINDRYQRKNVVVVCPTGGITVGMLVLRLQNELPNINVVDVLSIREFNTKSQFSEIDAVITTSPALKHSKLKVVCVSPLLGKEDVIVIRKQLNMDGNHG